MDAMALAHTLPLAHPEAMPDDGRRYELIGGAIVMTPAPGPAHQRVSRRLLMLLEAATPTGHEVFDAPIDLDLPGEQRVQHARHGAQASRLRRRRHPGLLDRRPRRRAHHRLPPR